MKRVPVQAAAMAKKLLLGVVALAALAWPSEVVAQGVKATVLSIGDGDTIRVRQAGKALTVRLACIDAPETAQSPYGQQVT
jgi:endonuclease YncB( thermonuclease family)